MKAVVFHDDSGAAVLTLGVATPEELTHPDDAPERPVCGALVLEDSGAIRAVWLNAAEAGALGEELLRLARGGNTRE